MSITIPIVAASPVVSRPTPVRPYDFERARSLMGTLGEEGNLEELVFICGQTLIISHRRGMPVPLDVAELTARPLLIGPAGVDFAGTYHMLKAYPEIHDAVEFKLNELLEGEDPATYQQFVGNLNQRANRWGFMVPQNAQRLRLVDFTGMPFPMSINGRPEIGTVWIEATNQVNQKCTFCPDPGRETPRELADFEVFKERARQLHEGFDIGYWQMNAYGEPLLHPRLMDMIQYIRSELKSKAPVYFTTHGLTLTEPRIAKLLTALPNEVMISLHNDAQESYAISRSDKIGDYATLVSRIFPFASKLIAGKHPCSVRMSVLVDNAHAHPLVAKGIRSAFADNPERFHRMCVDWQERFRTWASANSVEAQFPDLDFATISRIFTTASRGLEHIIPLVQWNSPEGPKIVFLSPRPVSTYANLLPYQADKASVTPLEGSGYGCGFRKKPSLTIFANGKLGICCIDLETTANFGHAHDHATLAASFKTDACREMFANIAFGVADHPGCAICLSVPTAPVLQ